MPMKIIGFGMWIWVIDSCEGGDIDAIIRVAKEHNVKYIMPKATNGTILYSRNWTKVNDVPRIKSLAIAAHEAGIAVIPWGWSFGKSPYSPFPSISVPEARIAAQAVKELNADGWIVDAEHDWKRTGMAAEVDIWMDAFESEMVLQGRSIPVFVSTYRYPNLHRAFPYATWRDRLNPERGDGWMPQVYWEMDYRSSAGEIQLAETLNQYQPFLSSGGKQLKFIPAGSGYSRGDWSATPAQISGFLAKAITIGVPANLWSWQHMTPNRWSAVKSVWGGIVLPDPPDDGEDEPPPVEPVPYIKKSVVVAYALNVRKGPNLANPIARDALRKDEIVKIYEIEGSWGRISEDKCEWISLYWTRPVA